MSVPFYEFSEMDVPESWYLKILRDGQGADGARYEWRDLTWAQRVSVAPPLKIGVNKSGTNLDVSFDEVKAPVLSSRAAHVLRSLAGDEIELIPARVEGEAEEYFVLNILSVVRCLDEEKTQHVRKWTKDSARPDRVGDYHMLFGIVIDAAAATGHNLFRLGGSLVHIIASRAVKEAFEKERLTGVRFRDVCSPKPSLEEAEKAKPRYQEFYEKLLKPLVEVYGPPQNISSAVVGFDGGGPVKTCTLRAHADDEVAAYVTCELAVREKQKPSSLGRFELLTICDDPEWARTALTRLSHTSMDRVLDVDDAVDLGPMPKPLGSLEGVLLEAFSRRRVEGQNYAIFRCVGITRPELEFARGQSVAKLRERLAALDAHASTKCGRESVV